MQNFEDAAQVRVIRRTGPPPRTQRLSVCSEGRSGTWRQGTAAIHVVAATSAATQQSNLPFPCRIVFFSPRLASQRRLHSNCCLRLSLRSQFSSCGSRVLPAVVLAPIWDAIDQLKVPNYTAWLRFAKRTLALASGPAASASDRFICLSWRRLVQAARWQQENVQNA
jgi:hypothetical protein